MKILVFTFWSKLINLCFCVCLPLINMIYYPKFLQIKIKILKIIQFKMTNRNDGFIQLYMLDLYHLALLLCLRLYEI